MTDTKRAEWLRTPSAREKQRAAMRRPEVREKIRAGNKATWARKLAEKARGEGGTDMENRA